MDRGGVAEDARQSRATSRPRRPGPAAPSPGIGLVEPGGEADAAGDGIQFGDAEAVFGDEQVGANDAGQFVLEGGRALECDQVGGFALVEPARDPFRLLAFDALAVEQIDRAIELQQHAPERFQLVAPAPGPSGNGAGEMRQSWPAKRPSAGRRVAHEACAVGGSTALRSVAYPQSHLECYGPRPLLICSSLRS